MAEARDAITDALRAVTAAERAALREARTDSQRAMISEAYTYARAALTGMRNALNAQD